MIDSTTNTPSDAYDRFLSQKRFFTTDAGIDLPLGALNPMLFDFQKVMVQWALRKGRACLFADTGLGKSFCELEWSWQIHINTGGIVLIVAPLAVAQQTVREGRKFGVLARLARSQEDVTERGIYVTNYDRLHLFDLSAFVGIVLDESSILKSYTGKTTQDLIDRCANIPYRLACSATPAPNDHEELGNHAEFLGVMTRTEMLSQYFVHDGGDTSKWRLMGHADEAFWQFVGTWAVAIRKPSDLGFPNDGYDLPPLHFTDHCIDMEECEYTGRLFPVEAETLTEQRQVKRRTLGVRASHASALARTEHTEQFLIWCELNDESAQVTKLIPDAVEVKGADSTEHKEKSMLDFAEGNLRVLVSKSSICGFGMNFQKCARHIFVGVNHSYEKNYQGIRRCWRFGQTRPVMVHRIYSPEETPVIRNLKRKEDAHEEMSTQMVQLMCSASGIATPTTRQFNAYTTKKEMTLPCWI